ncbi:TIGR03885 family FMN-dependent LLM class oxidoreductase [Laspinema olomoucense]|uniref:TIGR03885 family FMN-dependent LLM class oxidoreductase n=1 Tax=Laspinema olomoucense TaxID=3231600 RepID=UPI0021BA51C5|nr:TIGR03885 family FMN-dependent LLM class oxidoreductase [Laspinema sp. D3a]MCT7988036.1 TIGR03885 family FMN-dependent LLM class oxidoreductase [Laspinema sp. D3a]
MMTEFAYHASHEQFKPSVLLKYIQMAERAGFTAGSSSDHFKPWSDRQGESGFSWAWLGAAMQATSLPCSVVCAPGPRYHPTIVAQAVATLAEMFPNRFSVALGSGEAINERITGDRWPSKPERNARLKESVDIIRALFAGETVNHSGLFTVQQAKLYTRPDYSPPIFGAAITVETAEWVGSWADGLLTTSRPPEELQKVVEAFHRGGGKGKPMHLKVQLSYAQTREQARQGAYEQWRTNIFKSSVLAELSTPEELEAAAQFVKPEDMDGQVRISADLEQHIQWLRDDMELGFNRLILHNVNLQQEEFIKAFGDRVLPALSGDRVPSFV